MQPAELFRALGNERRLQILHWLGDPVSHFPAQREGDLVIDGVCGQSLSERLGVTPSTLSEHMRILQASGLITATRVRQWTFYRRNDERLREIAAVIGNI